MKRLLTVVFVALLLWTALSLGFAHAHEPPSHNQRMAMLRSLVAISGGTGKACGSAFRDIGACVSRCGAGDVIHSDCFEKCITPSILRTLWVIEDGSRRARAIEMKAREGRGDGE